MYLIRTILMVRGVELEGPGVASAPGFRFSRVSVHHAPLARGSYPALELFEIAQPVETTALDFKGPWKTKLGVFRPPPTALRAAAITPVNLRTG
jgi:hypothetical protein